MRRMMFVWAVVLAFILASFPVNAQDFEPPPWLSGTVRVTTDQVVLELVNWGRNVAVQACGLSESGEVFTVEPVPPNKFWLVPHGGRTVITLEWPGEMEPGQPVQVSLAGYVVNQEGQFQGAPFFASWELRVGETADILAKFPNLRVEFSENEVVVEVREVGDFWFVGHAENGVTTPEVALTGPGAVRLPWQQAVAIGTTVSLDIVKGRLAGCWSMDAQIGEVYDTGSGIPVRMAAAAEPSPTDEVRYLPAYWDQWGWAVAVLDDGHRLGPAWFGRTADGKGPYGALFILTSETVVRLEYFWPDGRLAGLALPGSWPVRPDQWYGP